MKGNMLRLRLMRFALPLVFFFSLPLVAQTQPTDAAADHEPAPATTAPATSPDQVIDRAIEREHFFIAQMRHLHPLVETYLQNLRNEKESAATAPASDVYFLGRLDMSNGTDDRPFVAPSTSAFPKRLFSKLSNVYAMKFLPLGFAQMVIIDEKNGGLHVSDEPAPAQ